MKHLEVAYDDGEVRAALTVRASTSEIETERAFLLLEAQNVVETKRARFLLRQRTYPDALASTEGAITIGETEYRVDSLPFDVLCDLPGQFVDKWLDAVYQLNHHWLPVEPEEAKKAVPPSTPDSTA